MLYNVIKHHLHLYKICESLKWHIFGLMGSDNRSCSLSKEDGDVRNNRQSASRENQMKEQTDPIKDGTSFLV